MMANGITNLRSPIDERLSKVFTPSPDSKKVTGAESMTESIARGTRAEQALPDVMRMTSEAERAAVGEVGRERVQGAERLGSLGREQAKGIVELEQKYQELRPKPIEFTPSQENIGDLQNIMAQMVLIGGLVGGASKRSGIAGLKAIKGMLDGYKQGRKDIFDKEKLIYEKALETQRNELTMLKDLFESQNRARVAGNTAEMNALQAELNARTLNGAANIDLVRGDNKRFIDQLTYAINAKDKAATLQEQIRSREEQAREAARARAAAESARRQSFKAIGVDESGNVVMANDYGETRTMSGVQPSTKSQEFKPPPQTVLEANRLRSTLIPKIEKALPVLDRLSKEPSTNPMFSTFGGSKWTELTSLLAADPRAAEFRFKDDPEAVNLILTLAYFRSKEFETAGKALTRKEDQILAPIVRGDLRTYEGLRNAMVEGAKTLKQEQVSLERSYPFIARENAAYRGELSGQESGKPPMPSPFDVSIPTGAIELLKSNPAEYREAFEKKYKVRADVYLSGSQ
jgi:hypothetical protein